MRKARQAAARRGRRLRIMFADEARFGRINRPRPCWAPIGTRPAVASQLIREYIIDAVRAKLKQAILYIERNPKIVQSITSFPYIATSL